MSRALHRFAIAVALATFGLIIAGALVTSTGSALAVPDWPLSYGRFFPPMVGGILFEHGHRMIAGIVGILTMVLVFWLWRSARGTFVVKLGYTALLTIFLQALLGGITVLFLLPLAISVGHACLGQTFFCLVVSIAFFTSQKWKAIDRTKSDETPVVAAVFTTGAIYLQLLLGALMRHSQNGLVASPIAHIVWAAVVWSGALWTWIRARSRLAALLLGLVSAQIALGAATFLTERPVVFTVAHVAMGATILALSLILTFVTILRFGSAPLRRVRDKCKAYFELTKPRITMLASFTTAAGYYLASTHFHWGELLITLMATSLVASGASALNEYMERDYDKLMVRTARRPLPEGRISPQRALIFSFVITIIGLLFLRWKTNSLATSLAFLTLLTYLGLYTPMKRWSAFCTVVGALPGALPPLIGWAAASGHLNYAAGVLFAILFLWQLPHFWAIAWLYREDYARAGFPMLPVVDPTGRQTSRQTIFSLGALLAVALFPLLAGMAGLLYSVSAAVLGILFLITGVHLARTRTKENARRVLLASVTYLPLILILMAIDKQ